MEALEDRRLLSAGQLGAGYGSGGVATLLESTRQGAATALQSDGKVILAGPEYNAE